MKHKCKEIFQLLRRHDENCSFFSDEIVNNWYRARRYVLDHIHELVSNNGFYSLRIAINGHSPLTYSVVRHLALIAHFSSFDEGNEDTFSKITILYPQKFTLDDLKAEIETLGEEEFLFNLIKYSQYTLIDAEGKTISHSGLPFLDIKFVLRATDNYENCSHETYITEDAIREYTDNKTITSFSDEELTAAMLVNQAYSTGVEIKNLPSTENEKASRYSMALDCLNSRKRKMAKSLWQKCFEDKTELPRKKITNILSCIFCADTFEIRLHELMKTSHTLTHTYLIANINTIRRAIVANLKALSKSEHARWNTEKLILGFRPFSDKQSYTDEISVGKRDAYRKKQKDDSLSPSHIDLLSYANLKRINPEDQKSDSFIMLAMPTILIQKYQPKQLIPRIILRII